MDSTTGLIIVVIVVCGLAAFALWKNKGGKAEVSGAGIKMKTGPADRQHGAVIEGAKSTSGGARAEDEGGAGALIKDTEVAGDLTAINRNPESQSPKV